MIHFETTRGRLIFKSTASYVKQGRETHDEEWRIKRRGRGWWSGTGKKDIRAGISLCSWTGEQKSPFTFRHVLTWSAHVWHLFLPSYLPVLLCFLQQLPHWQNLSHSSVTNSTHRREGEGGREDRKSSLRVPSSSVSLLLLWDHRSGKT